MLLRQPNQSDIRANDGGRGPDDDATGPPLGPPDGSTNSLVLVQIGTSYHPAARDLVVSRISGVWLYFQPLWV